MQETLIHEMAHAATDGTHEEKWKAEMARLRRQGAPTADVDDGDDDDLAVAGHGEGANETP